MWLTSKHRLKSAWVELVTITCFSTYGGQKKHQFMPLSKSMVDVAKLINVMEDLKKHTSGWHSLVIRHECMCVCCWKRSLYIKYWLNNGTELGTGDGFQNRSYLHAELQYTSSSFLTVSIRPLTMVSRNKNASIFFAEIISVIISNNVSFIWTIWIKLPTHNIMHKQT